MAAETFSAETIPALLAERAGRTPGLEAIVGDDLRLDYAGLERASVERAAWLVARGVNKGHRVGLLMGNGVEWAVNAYAVMRIGAVLVPLSTLLRPPERMEQLAAAGVRHLIAAAAHRGRDFRAEFLALDRALLPSLREIWWEDEMDAPDAAAVAMAAALTARVVPADDMVILFTAGSRGRPKGVIHTQGAAIRANRAGLADRCIEAGTRLYLPMPFFWVGGFAAGLISALNAGATLLTEAVPEPAGTLRFLASEHVTLFRGWPDQAAALAAHPDFVSTDLHVLAAGSLNALLPPALRAAPGARANTFGMTESFGPYAGYPLDLDMPADKWGSCGRPFEGMKVRIADSKTGEILAADAVGSIQIGGHNILRGICGHEREEIFTPDRWYDTGDLGRIDTDGFLWLTGRKDDMIKVKGVSVYPSEVEAALEAIPGVARAFVTDVLDGGAVAIGAAVVVRDTELDAAALVAALRPNLSSFKIPSRWVMLGGMSELPRTASGKIDKPALQALIAGSV